MVIHFTKVIYFFILDVGENKILAEVLFAFMSVNLKMNQATVFYDIARQILPGNGIAFNLCIWLKGKRITLQVLLPA